MDKIYLPESWVSTDPKPMINIQRRQNPTENRLNPTFFETIVTSSGMCLFYRFFTNSRLNYIFFLFFIKVLPPPVKACLTWFM